MCPADSTPLTEDDWFDHYMSCPDLGNIGWHGYESTRSLGLLDEPTDEELSA